MKRGAITTLPGLREAFIVSKKRMHSYRVTSRLLSTRSIRLKRCSTTAKDDTMESYAAISLSPFAIRTKKSGSLDTPRGDRDHHAARSQLFHVHIEYERRNRPKILHQKNIKKPFHSPRTC